MTKFFLIKQSRIFLSVLLATVLLSAIPLTVYAEAPGASFRVAANYGAGNDPQSVAIGDFNGDSKPDLAVANSFSNYVSILLGKGDGTFETAENYDVGEGAQSVAVGDFNNDGNLDLAVANYDGNNVSVLPGNGDGTFQDAENYDVGEEPYSVVVGDFNNDGNLDLAVANYDGNNVSVLLGNGDGTFQDAENYDVGGHPQSAAVGDFNNDGKSDLAVANYDDNNISVLLGNVDGTFQDAANYDVGYGPQSVAVGDFDSDGNLDLAVANYSFNDVSVLMGNGNGVFQETVKYCAGSGPYSVAAGDFDDDGNLDLAVANRNSRDVSVLMGYGGGNFHAAANYDAGEGPSDAAVGDFNGDGNLDLAVANQLSDRVTVLMGNGAGAFQFKGDYGVGDEPSGVIGDDFDGDGKLDLAVVCYENSDVFVFLGNGDGTFQAATTCYAGSNLHDVASGDFDRDGNVDLAVAVGPINKVSVLLGNGNGTFGEAEDYGVGTYPRSVAVGDFNGDGNPDLATANGWGNNVSVLLGNGDGTFGTAANYPAGNYPFCVTVGDFNKDGKSDLAVTDLSDINVSVFLANGEGDGTFGGAVSYDTGYYTQYVTVGDFNGDDNPDLAVAGDDIVFILLGDGNGVFQAEAGFGVGSSPESVAVGDFNGDGRLDLVTSNYGGDSVTVLLNNAAGNPVEPDTAPPSVDNRTITVSVAAHSAVTLSWSKAMDDVSPQDTLRYLVYYSNSNNIASVTDAENNGTASGDYETDISAKEINGLENGATYYFNVIVMDEAGNKTAYTMKRVSLTDSGPDGGSGDNGGSDDIAAPDYKAIVSGTDALKITLPVNVNTSDGIGTTDLGNLAKDIFAGTDTAVLTVPSIPDVNSYTLEIPAASLSGSQGKGTLAFSTCVGSITIPSGMLSGIQETEGKKAGITISRGDMSGLPAEVQTAIGDRLIIQLTLTLDGKQTEWNNPEAPVTVSIPYTPTEAELADPEHIVVWYIDGSGNVVSVPNGRYDPATGTVTFTTTHFSYYAVAYVRKTFDDLDGVEWARKTIEVMASKGIINGTGANSYSPEASISRADYLVLLIKTQGLTTNFEGNFDDVSPGAYYYEAVGIAKKLGIAAGSGSNRFNPGEGITRQDMMVLTTRALEKFRGLKVSGADGLSDKFSDKGDIADYAVSSIAALVKEGLIAGSGERLNPRAYATRAEAAVFLYRIYNR